MEAVRRLLTEDLGEAPPAVAYRVFRDGQILVVKDRRAFVERKARAILESSISGRSKSWPLAVSWQRPRMVDRGVLAKKLAAIRAPPPGCAI